ncbi:MAG: DNA repair exonuclease SbcCD ATPase subunit [Halopseudomonas sp.]|jgi:DNA repair exonuclease SbcCD ATPase subunit
MELDVTSKDNSKQTAPVITPLHLLQTLTRTLNEHLAEACREAEKDARKAMEKLTRQHTKLQEKLAEAEDKLVEKQHTGADRKAIEKSEQKIASLKQGLNELQEARNAADTYTRQLQSDVRQTLRIAKGLERIESQSDLAIEKRNNPKPQDKPASRPRKPRNRKPAASKPTGENEKPRAEADGNV